MGKERQNIKFALSVSRIPQTILAHIFSYLSVPDLACCAQICRHWNLVFEHYDLDIWSHHVKKEVPSSALSDHSLFSNLQNCKEKLRAFRFAWNPLDCSRNTFVRTNCFTAQRQPVAQSTDGIRGKIGVSQGIHCWEIIWEGPLGTTAVIGIATKHAALHCPGYVTLIGSDDQSWGWNLVDCTLIQDGSVIRQYPRVNNLPKYKAGERIRMILDCSKNLLYFEKDSQFLGLAFTNIPPVKLFPAMCAVYGNTEVSMIYMGQPIVG